MYGLQTLKSNAMAFQTAPHYGSGYGIGWVDRE
jgi:hypothetical protein